MTARILLDRLLYHGILEIRYSVTKDDKDDALDLLNLLHTVPNSMARIEADEDYELILKELRERALGRGRGEWLEKLEKHIHDHSK